jgi:hypothetical protein
MERQFRLIQPTKGWSTGEWGQGIKTITISRGDHLLEVECSEDGCVSFDWPWEWIDKVEVEGVDIKSDWSVGDSSDLGFIEVADVTEVRPEEQEEQFGGFLGMRRESAVHGQLFYYDGTMASEEMEVTIELSIEQSSAQLQYTETSRPDGSFYIPTPEFQREARIKQMWIKTAMDGEGQPIPEHLLNRNRDGHYTVIMPKRWGHGNGDRGGLITGKVIDHDGQPLVGAKIAADVENAGFFGFIGGNNHAETYSESGGRFVLQFAGGVQLKKLYVDGHEPISLSIGFKDPQPLANKDIRAGTFGLVLEDRKPFLGIRWRN